MNHKKLLFLGIFFGFVTLSYSMDHSEYDRTNLSKKAVRNLSSLVVTMNAAYKQLLMLIVDIPDHTYDARSLQDTLKSQLEKTKMRLKELKDIMGMFCTARNELEDNLEIKPLLDSLFISLIKDVKNLITCFAQNSPNLTVAKEEFEMLYHTISALFKICRQEISKGFKCSKSYKGRLKELAKMLRRYRLENDKVITVQDKKKFGNYLKNLAEKYKKTLEIADEIATKDNLAGTARIFIAPQSSERWGLALIEGSPLARTVLKRTALAEDIKAVEKAMENGQPPTKIMSDVANSMHPAVKRPLAALVTNHPMVVNLAVYMVNKAFNPVRKALNALSSWGTQLIKTEEEHSLQLIDFLAMLGKQYLLMLDKTTLSCIDSNHCGDDSTLVTKHQSMTFNELRAYRNNLKDQLSALETSLDEAQVKLISLQAIYEELLEHYRFLQTASNQPDVNAFKQLNSAYKNLKDTESTLETIENEIKKLKKEIQLCAEPMRLHKKKISYYLFEAAQHNFKILMVHEASSSIGYNYLYALVKDHEEEFGNIMTQYYCKDPNNLPDEAELFKSWFYSLIKEPIVNRIHTLKNDHEVHVRRINAYLELLKDLLKSEKQKRIYIMDALKKMEAPYQGYRNIGYLIGKRLYTFYKLKKFNTINNSNITQLKQDISRNNNDKQQLIDEFKASLHNNPLNQAYDVSRNLGLFDFNATDIGKTYSSYLKGAQRDDAQDNYADTNQPSTSGS